MGAGAKTVTILFTDLVGSTELLQRAGDEQAQRIFKAHHRLLRGAVEAHGGHEVKWLGDGLMVAFDSAADAVRCAIAMQQSSRRPTAGERLEIRAGLNVGEAFVDEADYFGTSVVIARRLCDSGGPGEIRASDIVVRLLDGWGADITTKDLGALELKGITNAVPAVEIVYQHDPMALLRKLPFVGRQAEYGTLLKKLAEARNGRGSVVLLAGEPGIAKTRLTEEFCDHASSVATVIRGNCYEGDVAAPFGPWVEALRSLLDQTPDAELRDTLGPGAPDIAAILPEIRRRLPDIEEAPKLDPEAERARLFDSIAAWLRNAADNKPLVIFLDDLHWCDRPSLALLEQVARGCVNQRIVIVGTYRDVEVDRVHPLAQTLAALRRIEHHERIALKGFSEESVYELLSAIEPSEQAEAAKRGLAQVLFTESEGNPFFLREVLNNLVETGKLAQQDGVWVGTVASIEELGIPEGIKEVIGRRLSRLSETCNRMLGRASAMTGGFTWDELQAICDDAADGPSEDALLDALDEALGSQLIAERERNAYAFTHALIRATLYDELSTPRRVQLHRRIAESLESLYAESIDDHLGELAAHYMASTGNAAEKAVEYSIRAGDRARELFAWEDAAVHYERALEAMSLVQATPHVGRGKVLLAMARCHKLAGKADESLATLRQAAEAARALRDAETLAGAAIWFSETAQKLDRDVSDERIELLDEALAMLGSSDSPIRAIALAQRVQSSAARATAQGGVARSGFLVWAGAKDEALLAQAHEALAMATRMGDDEAIAQAAYVVANSAWSPDNDADRLLISTEGLAAAQRAANGVDQLLLRSNRLSALMGLGEIDQLRADIQAYMELDTRIRNRGEFYVAPSFLAAIELAQGHLAIAEQRIDDYGSEVAGHPTATVNAAGQRFVLRWLQGRLGEIEVMWRGVVAGFPGLHIMRAAYALIQASIGRAADASENLRELGDIEFTDIPRDFLWKGTMLILSDVAVDTGNVVSAESLHDHVAPYALAHVSIGGLGAFGSMARIVGRLAALLERWDEAEQHFETALASNERQGFHAWVAWTRLNYGETLLKRAVSDAAKPDDRERAITLLNDSLAFAKEAGMGKVERDAEALLAVK